MRCGYIRAAERLAGRADRCGLLTFRNLLRHQPPTSCSIETLVNQAIRRNEAASMQGQMKIR